jgi:hypothetical protein
MLSEHAPAAALTMTWTVPVAVAAVLSVTVTETLKLPLLPQVVPLRVPSLASSIDVGRPELATKL